ncbi:MAG: hypothetical protein WCO23_02550 [bacterium]
MSNYQQAVIFTTINDFDGSTVDFRFAGQALPVGSIPIRIVQIQNPDWGTERIVLDLGSLEGAEKTAVDHETARVMLGLFGQLTDEDVEFVALNAPDCCFVHRGDYHWSFWASHDGKPELVERLVKAGADINFVQNGKTVLDVLESIIEVDEEGSWPWQKHVLPVYQALGAKRAHELSPKELADFAFKDEQRRVENERREAAKAARRNSQSKGWRRVERAEETAVAIEAIAEE